MTARGNHGSVACMAKKRGPKPIGPERLAGVDWDQTNVEIGRLLGCTAENARRLRERHGRPRSVQIETPPDDAPIREVLGWRIRMHRLRRGWYGEHLAERVNDLGGSSWRKPGISALERGVGRGLTLAWLGRFAAALGVTPADLLLLPGQTALADPPAMVGDPPDPADLQAVVGSNVRRWRVHRDLDPRELGARVGDISGAVMNATRVGYIESAQYGRTLDVAFIEPWAQALAVTPADLVRLPRQPDLLVESG